MYLSFIKPPKDTFWWENGTQLELKFSESLYINVAREILWFEIIFEKNYEWRTSDFIVIALFFRYQTIYKCTPEEHQKLVHNTYKTTQRLKRQKMAARRDRKSVSIAWVGSNFVIILTDWLQDFMSNYVYTEYESNLGSNEHYVENISQLTCYLSW